MAEIEIGIEARLKTHPVFRALSKEVLERVASSGRLTAYREGRTFVRAGDPVEQVLVILTGSVRVHHRDASGALELAVRLIGAPAILGDMEAVAGLPFMELSTTLEPSEVFAIPARIFVEMVLENLVAGHAVAEEMSRRLCRGSDHQRCLAFADVEQRLINLLLDYAELLGDDDGAGNLRLRVSLSQDDLARDLAISRKALTQALAKLKDEGLVNKEEARYVIKNAEQLRARASRKFSLSYREG